MFPCINPTINYIYLDNQHLWSFRKRVYAERFYPNGDRSSDIAQPSCRLLVVCPSLLWIRAGNLPYIFGYPQYHTRYIQRFSAHKFQHICMEWRAFSIYCLSYSGIHAGLDCLLSPGSCNPIARVWSAEHVASKKSPGLWEYPNTNHSHFYGEQWPPNPDQAFVLLFYARRPFLLPRPSATIRLTYFATFGLS